MRNSWAAQGIDLSKVVLSNIDLRGASFSEVDFSNVDLSGADLSETKFSEGSLKGYHDIKYIRVNLEEALSLKGTNLRGVTGLTKEQLEACKAKWAITDEELTTSSSQSTIASPLTKKVGKHQ